MGSPRRVLDRRSVWWTSAIVVPLVAAAAIVVPIAASGAVDLPDKSVKELIEFAGASEVDALSGTIEQTSELGLPDLGTLTGSRDGSEGGPDDGSSPADLDDLISLATGSHTAKVYLDGESARLQVLDQLGERNVYVDGAAEEIWYVDSETQTATKLNLPAGAPKDRSDPDDTLPTPDEVLDQALARLDETTDVTVGTDSRVAGRDVYELILEPRTPDTLVGDVRVAIDGENGVALAASVTARGASAPAFEVAFTQVDFSAPDSAVFAFEPGTDMAVTEKDVALPGGQHDHDGKKTDAAAAVIIGEGWSAVAELPGAAETGEQGAFAGLDAEQLAMLESITTAVDGGRAVQTALMSVLFTDDGRVLVGAVPASRLVEAAQTGR
ncbi:outer membrane lipoprotein carrier protein LolA [Microbacterium sp. NPDC056569]|uniref:LolA family protein n=1 Tax=Microbacterium sp. NPDC056569 TaxID=3345867 RepID=UPI00366FB5D9